MSEIVERILDEIAVGCCKPSEGEAQEIAQIVGESVIARIAAVAEAIGWQANVGGMETAGSIISYLARFPAEIGPFLRGETSVMDWPRGWHTLGSLTWHGQDGKIHRPEDVRRHNLIKRMENGQ